MLKVFKVEERFLLQLRTLADYLNKAREWNEIGHQNKVLGTKANAPWNGAEKSRACVLVKNFYKLLLFFAILLILVILKGLESQKAAVLERNLFVTFLDKVFVCVLRNHLDWKMRDVTFTLGMRCHTCTERGRTILSLNIWLGYLWLQIVFLLNKVFLHELWRGPANQWQ